MTLKCQTLRAALLSSVAAVLLAPQIALAQEDSSGAPDAQGATALEEIIVTAQKRAQSINAVGMSITAQSAEALAQRGVAGTADLVKVVPGLTFAPSPFATPVYTLRAVGLYDNGYASSPAVSIYVDQAPLPFPVLQAGAALDLERVEVLKGPQGTLFGQSSTGGAINYIAAKPTPHFAAGADASIQNFGRLDASGFVSGPVSDTLRARLALRAVQGGAWQYSTTRRDDKLGDARQLYGRLLLEWTPNDRLAVSLNLNGSHDGSDVQAGQLSYNQLNVVAAPTAQNPYAIVNPSGFASLTTPGSPAFNPSFAQRQALVFARLGGAEGAVVQAGTQAYLSEPVVGKSARAANWTPSQPERLDSDVYQAVARADYKLSEIIRLTSITSLARFDGNTFVDIDASAAAGLDYHIHGNLRALNQEFRMAGDTERLHWVVGVGYDYAKSRENYSPNIPFLSLNEVFPGLTFTTFDAYIYQNIRSKSAFANVEYAITDALSVQGGIRYTDTSTKGSYCERDNNPGATLNATFLGLQQAFAALGLKNTPITAVAPSQCQTLTPLPDARPTITPLALKLSEDNVSWRVGATYKLDGGPLLYANVSRGYKAGIFTPIGASLTEQLAPARQERLDSFEIGVKAPFLDHRLQLNAAYFHYDYKDKQVRARVLDPVFGLLEKLVNVPEARVDGVEVELTAQPIKGLALSVASTYLDSKISGPTSGFYNQAGYLGDFEGSRLPYTPKFTLVADGQYEWPVRDGIEAFVGGSVVYHSQDNATFGTDTLRDDDFRLPSYATVDLRAGLAAESGAWRVSAFARNVFDKYYLTSVFNSSDTIYRFAGQPATYGLSLQLRTW